MKKPTLAVGFFIGIGWCAQFSEMRDMQLFRRNLHQSDRLAFVKQGNLGTRQTRYKNVANARHICIVKLLLDDEKHRFAAILE